MSKTRLMTAATMGVAGLLLTGCGSASPGGRGQGRRRDAHASATSTRRPSHYCTSVGDQFESPVPMSFVRQYVVQLLTLRSQADQIADDYGVTRGLELRERRRAAPAHRRGRCPRRSATTTSS